MSTNFEFGDIPGGILVSRTLNKSERSLVGRIIVVDIEGNFD